ncbi:hypothetical protein NDU88_002478 [Pleurodeles waltl]|uniref:Uncharacterized protein n=1 Tax=Pleurodeles waltl TaxID=8319 RepID=A0AAV7VF04_PLEWA|nr:hypothetical protein NDU88_002478 [Pleurodeles waltl]
MMPGASPSPTALRAVPGVIQKAGCEGPRVRDPTTSRVQAAVKETDKGGGGGAAGEQALRSCRSVPAPSGRTQERQAHKAREPTAQSTAPGRTPCSTSSPGIASLRCLREPLSPLRRPRAALTTLKWA